MKQPWYNPWHRQPELDGVLEYCEQEKLTFLPWGTLGTRTRINRLEDMPILVELAREKGVSVYNIVLAWLREKSQAIVPIPGASKVSTIEDSARGVEVKLTVEEVQKVAYVNG